MIHRMRASFGKLHDTLELQPGLNYLCLPNEAGKSTWSAFLVAMLYGIDTSERANAANQGLPAKERYRPWDGSPMEGTIELEWKGREITIERKTERRTPMGAFRAYETASGTPIPELTGENCGKVLCGVERSVFERTAFIRQLGMAVTPDAVLEKRLGALVTTGEEGAMSYSQLETALKGYKNRLTGRAGKLPKLRNREAALQGELRRMESLRREVEELREEEAQAERERRRLEELEQRVRRAQNGGKKSGLEELRERLRGQETVCSRLERAVAELPGEADLQRLQRELDAAERNLQTVRMDADLTGDPVERPVPPAGFAGMTGTEAKQAARADMEEYQKLTASGKKSGSLLSILLIGAGLGLALFGGIKGFYALLWGGLLFAIAGLAGLVFVRKMGKNRKNQAEQLLRRYGVTDCDGILALAEDYDRRCAEAEEERMLRQQRLEQAQKGIQAIVEEVQRFAPNFADTVSCREALAAGLKAHEHLAGERRTLELLRKQYASVEAMLREEDEDPEAMEMDLEEVTRQARHAKEESYRLTAMTAERQGMLRAIGNASELEAQLNGVQEEIIAGEEQYEGVNLALEALKRADEALRSRFSPQITADAGEILAELTGGKYPKLLLQPDMRLSVREEDGIVMRSAAAMSCGTGDQMYLSLRLAMCGRLLPEDAPLVLDDALVNFDDQRAEAAMNVLKKLAEKRQIIFFTCHEIGER